MEAYIILFYLFLVLLVASFVFVLLDFLLYSLFGFSLANFVYNLLKR